MKRSMMLATIAVAALGIVLFPSRAASQQEPPVIEVVVSLTDLPPAVVNVTAPEQEAPVIQFPEQPAPVVNVQVPEFPAIPAPIVNVAASEPQVVYQDREVEVERIVEVPSCLDYADLPYFDLANALSVAFPGEPWSLSGSYYNGLVWHGETPKPDMTKIIGGWLQHLSADC